MKAIERFCTILACLLLLLVMNMAISTLEKAERASRQQLVESFR